MFEFEEHLLKAFENPGDKIFSANLYKVESIKILKIWGEKEEGEKYFWPLVKVTVENYDEEITIPFNEAVTTLTLLSYNNHLRYCTLILEQKFKYKMKNK